MDRHLLTKEMMPCASLVGNLKPDQFLDHLMVIMKIPSETEVAPRYTLLTLLILFTLFIHTVHTAIH